MKKGFTLLEILLTIVILSGGVAALAWAFSVGMAASSGLEKMESALNIARAKMEEVKSKDYATLLSEGDSGPTPDADFPDFSVSIDVAEGQDPMEVDVTVTWDVKGGEESVELTTLVTNYI